MGRVGRQCHRAGLRCLLGFGRLSEFCTGCLLQMNHPAPIRINSGEVEPDWIDYNGHMNLAYYVVAFDRAFDDFLDYIGLDAAYREATGCTTFALEAHTTYLRELKLGERYRIATQLLDTDAKRLHVFHSMTHETHGFAVATTEVLSMHIDLSGPRAADFPDAMRETLMAIASAHSALDKPAQAGRRIGIRRG